MPAQRIGCHGAGVYGRVAAICTGREDAAAATAAADGRQRKSCHLVPSSTAVEIINVRALRDDEPGIRIPLAAGQERIVVACSPLRRPHAH